MIDMEKIFFYETPVGKLCIGEEDGVIVRTTWSKIPTEYILEETELILQCKMQLDEYFRGERKTFDLPLAPKGTDFQKKVWNALQKIPYGETKTYGEIAAAVGNPKAARAVGIDVPFPGHWSKGWLSYQAVGLPKHRPHHSRS